MLGERKHERRIAPLTQLTHLTHLAAWKKTALGTSIELYASHSLEQMHSLRPIILMGGIHGDEPEGVRLANDTLAWLKELSKNNKSDQKTLCPWILIPCLNVDGFTNRTRVNGRGVDLNRNYPSSDWNSEAKAERYFPGPHPGSEPEIQAVVELITKYQPRLMIHFHSWKPCIVGAGPTAMKDTLRLSKSSGYEAMEDIGYPTPGSLSQYGFLDHGVPVICIEEQDEMKDLDSIWPRFKDGLREILEDHSLRDEPTDSQTSALPFAHIVFDLDDTLLDTYRQLIPRASREACTVMIDAGLATDLETCLKVREELAKTDARTDLYRNLVSRFGVRTNAGTEAAAAKTSEMIAEKGQRAFYDRKVENDISLFPGTVELLLELKTRYKIHLVTAGHTGTQQEKINILKLASVFDQIHIVDVMNGETKGQVFESIARASGHAPSRYLSVGNRLDTDIAPAKRLGWKTCWVLYGEYAHTSPHDSDETPDFKISRLEELTKTCRL